MAAHSRIKLTIVFLTAAIPVLAAQDVAHWRAAQPPVSQGLTLERQADSNWGIQSTPAGPVARLKPSDSYFVPAPYRFRISVPVPEDVWLVVEFLDEGYGLMTIAPGRPEAKQWGVARVNSGRVRSAVFHYDRSSLHESIQLTGLNYVKSVRLTTVPPEIAPVPMVEPGIQFRVPSQRVTTAAGEELSPDHVADAPAHLRNRLPLVRALGFNGVESYVKWGLVERSPGVFDWSFYDSVVDALEKHGL